jgi:heterodisulfide reductase subunit C
MSVLILEKSPSTLLEEVLSYPGGKAILGCIQCGTCSGSCPTSYSMDYTPRKLIAMIRANKREEVLNSLGIWNCTSCYTCSVRCPRGIKFTDIMYILKNLAYKQNPREKKNKALAFYRSFQHVLNRYGRVHEGEMMMRYALTTNPAKLLGFAPMGLKLFTKGRLQLLPHSIKGTEQLQELFKRAQAQ